MGLADYLKSVQAEDQVTSGLERYWSAKEQERAETWWKPRLYSSPSQAGSLCARDIELGVLGYRTAMDQGGQRRTGNGTTSHPRIQQYFQEAGIATDFEVKLTLNSETDRSGGEGGNMYVDVIDKWGHIGDIKTINSRGYRGLPEQLEDKAAMWRTMDYKYPYYTRQMAQYVVYFQEYYGKPISDDFFFYYENKDDQDYRVIWMSMAPDILEKAFELPIEAIAAARTGTLLDRPFSRNSKTCRRCFKETMCNKLEDGEEAATSAVRAALKITGGQ